MHLKCSLVLRNLYLDVKYASTCDVLSTWKSTMKSTQLLHLMGNWWSGRGKYRSSCCTYLASIKTRTVLWWHSSSSHMMVIQSPHSWVNAASQYSVRSFEWLEFSHDWRHLYFEVQMSTCIVGYLAVPIPHSHIWCILDKKGRAITFRETCQLVNLEIEHCLSGVSQGWKCVFCLQIWHLWQCATWFSALLGCVLYTKKTVLYQGCKDELGLFRSSRRKLICKWMS